MELEKLVRKIKINKRNGFSDRINKVEYTMQVTDLDKRTRNLIINQLDRVYWFIYSYLSIHDAENYFKYFLEELCGEIVTNNTNCTRNECWQFIEQIIINEDYADVYTLLEETLIYWMNQLAKKNIRNHWEMKTKIYGSFNSLFEKEYVGYRFVNRRLTPITNEIELSTIESATNISSNEVSSHLDKALMLLSDRNNPDYENSIKESITAVEALAQKITGNSDSLTLGKLLNKLETMSVKIHPALKNAFSSLYGFTSQANGVRHAGDIDGPNSTFAEAQFMLVACSAFVNYVHTNIHSDIEI